MQSDKAAKQKTVPGRLSVAALYLTVNGLLIPGAPRTDCQLRPKKLGINVGFTDIFFLVILTQSGTLDVMVIRASQCLKFLVFLLHKYIPGGFLITEV